MRGSLNKFLNSYYIRAHFLGLETPKIIIIITIINIIIINIIIIIIIIIIVTIIIIIVINLVCRTGYR